MQEYFDAKLKALEDIFAREIPVFERNLTILFLKHTYQLKKLEGKDLEKTQARFREFMDQSELLLRFFFHLDEFNRLNGLRSEIEHKKNSSLPAALDDEIQFGTAISGLERQIILCRKLKFLERSLVEIGGDHYPLSGIGRVLDEVYSVTGRRNVVKGLLEKFRRYYEVSLEMMREALVYKRITCLNSGGRQAKLKRGEWLGEMTFEEAGRLVSLLDETEAAKGRGISQDQRARQETFISLRKKLDETSAAVKNGDPKPLNPLEEGEMNLLVMRLNNVGQLEEQIAEVEKRFEDYRRKTSLDPRNTIVRAYNENIRLLTQCLYYYLELSMFRNPKLGLNARELQDRLQDRMRELDDRFADELAGNGEEPEGQAAGQAQAEARIEPDPEKKADLLAASLGELADSEKIKPLKALADFGSLEALRCILPVCTTGSGFIRNLARNAAIKICLRTLKEDEYKPQLGIQQKKKLVDLVVKLDEKYSNLRDMEISDPGVRQKVYDILIKEDREYTSRTIGEIIAETDEWVRA
ncbi:MAG: hypothetical protein U9P14_09025, partial [Gemmatimonadota bacterium]|nr:hypothetical protein [Gemmatimonadota bacterium]